MLKEHLKKHLDKHLNKIKTIKLKRHHYILWWFWIAAIIVLASIFGFQNIWTHAYDQGVTCSISVGKPSITVWEAGIAEITCTSYIWDLPSPTSLNANEIIEFDSWVLALRMLETPVIWEEQGGIKWTDEKTYRIRYTWKTWWTSTFNLKWQTILWENWYTQYTWNITVTEKDTTNPNCWIELNEITLIKWFSSTGKVTCNDVNDALYSTWVEYDNNVLSITQRWTWNEIEFMEQQASTRWDETIDYEITFKYKWIGSWETTIAITWNIAEKLWLPNNVEAEDTITVIEPNCYRTRPSTWTYININKTWKATFQCLNISWEIKEANISYDTGILKIIEYTWKEMSSNTQMEEEKQIEDPLRGNSIWTEYTIIYEATWLWTTQFEIINIQWVHNAISEDITVIETPNCDFTVTTWIMLNKTWVWRLTCENYVKSLFESYISYWDEIEIKERSNTIEGNISSARFVYKWNKTWNTTITINETGQTNIWIWNTVVRSDTIYVEDKKNNNDEQDITCSWLKGVWATTINEWETWAIHLSCLWTITWFNTNDYNRLRSTITWITNTIITWNIKDTQMLHIDDILTDPTFILEFTWNQSGQVELNINGKLNISWTNYTFTDANETTWYITVKWEEVSQGPTCTITWTEHVNLNGAWEIRVTCDWKKLFYDENNFKPVNALDYSWNIEIIWAPEATTGSTHVEIVYRFKWIVEWTSHLKLKSGIIADESYRNEEIIWNSITVENIITNIKCTWLTGGDTEIQKWTAWKMIISCNYENLEHTQNRILSAENGNILGVIDIIYTSWDVNHPNQYLYEVRYTWKNVWDTILILSWELNESYVIPYTPSPTIYVVNPAISKPIECSIEAEPDTVYVDQRWNIIVTCSWIKMNERLSSTWLSYEQDYIEVEDEVIGVVEDWKYTYTFIYTWTHPKENTILWLIVWVIEDGNWNSNGSATYSTWITIKERPIIEKPKCTIEINPTMVPKGYTWSITVTCDWENRSDITTGNLKYDSSIITINDYIEKTTWTNKTIYNMIYKWDEAWRTEFGIKTGAISYFDATNDYIEWDIINVISWTTINCTWWTGNPSLLLINQTWDIRLDCSLTFIAVPDAIRIVNWVDTTDWSIISYSWSIVETPLFTFKYTWDHIWHTRFTIEDNYQINQYITINAEPSEDIKVYSWIVDWWSCQRWNPTYDPIAVGNEAYIDLTCPGQQLHADGIETIWSIMNYTRIWIINTWSVELLTGWQTIRFHYIWANSWETNLKLSGAAQWYLYHQTAWSTGIHVIENTFENGPVCTITWTEMVLQWQTWTITVKCNNQYGILTTWITHEQLDYSWNIKIWDSVESGTLQDKTFTFIFTWEEIWITHLWLRAWAVKTVPGILNTYESWNNITVVTWTNWIHYCNWKPPVPDTPIRTGQAWSMILDCVINQRIPELLNKSETNWSLTESLTLSTESWPRILYYTWIEEWITQYAISGTIGNVHIQTEPYRSDEIQVINTESFTWEVAYENVNGEIWNSCTTWGVYVILHTWSSIVWYPERAFARNSTWDGDWTWNNIKLITENTGWIWYIRNNLWNILSIPYNVTWIVNGGPSAPRLDTPGTWDTISNSNINFTWIASQPDNCATINWYTMYILSWTNTVRSWNTGWTSIIPISLPNWTYTRYVKVADNFGQTAQSAPREFTIDNNMPECTITYVPPYASWRTNQNVTWTITCTDPTVTIITWTNVFTENWDLPFTVKDSNNNIRTITGHVDRIDKTAPECWTWTYNPELTEWTNSWVIATLAWSTDDLSGFGTGWGSCTIAWYGLTCNVTISDKAGNTRECTSSWATNIDTEDPTFNVIVIDWDSLYECQTWTAQITNASGWLSWLPTNAYIWNWITWNSGTYSQYSSIVNTQNITVGVIDNAWNITETGITFNWQDVELQIENTNQNLWQLTWETVINNVKTDLNVTAWVCESITASTTWQSHANCTLNGNKLTITPEWNYNWEWYCTIAFTDWDTTKTGKYTFTIDTIVNTLVLSLNPAWSEWTGNSITVSMTATNASWARYLLTWASWLWFNTCRNASNWGILVSNNTTPTIYEWTTTINTNWINYLYLCAQSLTWQEEIISWVYKIDTQWFTWEIWYENVNGGVWNSCTTWIVKVILHTWNSVSWYPAKAFARNSTWNSARTGNNILRLTDVASWTWYIRDNAWHIVALPYNVTWIVNEGPTQPTLDTPGTWDTISNSNINFTWIASQPDNCATINWYTMYILSWTNTVRSWNTGWTSIIPISLPNWTYTRYVKVADNFGQTAQSAPREFTIDNNMPECTITYVPPYASWRTNQNVTWTLTCTDTGVTIMIWTNVFTENWDLPFTVKDSSNNTRTITGHVTWIDKTPPFVSWHTNTTAWWYTWDLVYTFTYADTWAWVSWENTISCTIDTEWTWQTCSITNVNVCDKVWNCNNKSVSSQGINLDKSKPICWTWSYNPGSGTLTTWNVEATLSWSYDTISQINNAWWSCTVTWYNQNCNITISDNAWNTEVCTSENVTWIDTGAPILHEITAIWTTTDTTPNYTFSSTEPGTITYSWACSSATTWAVSWNNTITLNQLAYWTYSGCTITVTDSLWHTSDVLTISTFTIRQWGGGGWWWLHKDNCPDGDYSDSYYDWTCEWPKDICWVSKSKYDTELKTAYLYAYTHKMTTMCPIEDANLYWVIRRDELAKMLTEYALEVLDLEPQAWKSWCTAYNDIANSSAEMKYYMKTACELNIMWLESDGKTPLKSFYPHWLVSRAEFGTTLSRLIYGDAYNLESEAENTYPGAWYGKHLEALKRDEIMTKIYWDRPQHLELRWYVMLMIMRHWKARLDNVKNVPYSTKEEIMEIYNKNKALTCEVSYYESADDHGTWMIYVKDNKLRENYKINNEWNLSALTKNNKIYIRWDAIWTWMWMVADLDSTALEELEAMLEDETYTFKNCNEAVKNINAFELPSNVKFKTLGDWFTELSDSFASLFE